MSEHAEGVEHAEDSRSASARQFVIPRDPDTADALAGELGELATATEWKRAAIVYARVRVHDSQGRPPAEKVRTDLLTPEQYAQRGIHGLRSKTTVRAYWRAWDNAISEGLAQPVSLGDDVELPDAEWADYYHNDNHATPPYYVPPPNAETILDCEIPLPARDEDLGLGECPPLASNVEECDDVSARQHEPVTGREGSELAVSKERCDFAVKLIQGIDLAGICDLVALGQHLRQTRRLICGRIDQLLERIEAESVDLDTG